MKWGGADAPSSPVRRGAAFRALAAQGKAPWDGFWQAGPAAAPVLEKTQAPVKLEKKPIPPEKPGALVPKVVTDTLPPLPPALVTGGGTASWLIIVFQLGASLILSAVLNTILPVGVALCLAPLSIWMRRPNWGIFVFVMAIVWLMLRR
jgi:hypothetical protein